MSTEIILKLLKSGNWEDALIAFNFMKDWTMEDIKRELGDTRIDLVRSQHIIGYIQINKKIWACSGGIYSLGFYNREEYPEVEINTIIS